MEKVRFGIIGVGNMGSAHSKSFLEGKVENEQLYIGTEAVLPVKGVENQEVTVAIRPEGFELDAEGSFTCELNRVEVMGRDISVVCQHSAFTGAAIRAIIRSENLKEMDGAAVRFHLLPHKVFLFRKGDDTRIRF